jgi:DNA-binding transcriptional ArsR family regulator
MRTKLPQSSPAEVLFGDTRRGILGLLYNRAEEEFHLRDLARTAGVSPGAAHRELGLLVSAGFVARRKQGRQVFFRADPKSPVYEELKGLLDKLSTAPAGRPPEPVLRLLWDVDRSRVDIRQHRRFLIARVLDYGDPETVRWLRQTYGDEALLEVVNSGAALLPQTAGFWRALLRQGGADRVS